MSDISQWQRTIKRQEEDVTETDTTNKSIIAKQMYNSDYTRLYNLIKDYTDAKINLEIQKSKFEMMHFVTR